MKHSASGIVPHVAHAARELGCAKILQNLPDGLGRPVAVLASRASAQQLADDAFPDGFAGMLAGKLADPRKPVAELTRVDLAFVVGSGSARRVGEKPMGCGGEPRSAVRVARPKVGRVLTAVAAPERKRQDLGEQLRRL